MEGFLKEGLAENENDPRFHLALVRLYSRTQRSDEAVAQMQRLIELVPDKNEYHLALALLHWERKEFDQADQVLNHMIAESPKAHEVRLASPISTLDTAGFGWRKLSWRKGSVICPGQWNSTSGSAGSTRWREPP